MKHHEKHEDDSYYVGIEDPSQVRRAILETAKAVVLSAGMHHRVLDLQDEKLKLRTQLAHTVKEVRTDLEKLESILPHRDVQPNVAIVRAATTKRVADHHLDKIESALQEIEMRLRSN